MSLQRKPWAFPGQAADVSAQVDSTRSAAWKAAPPPPVPVDPEHARAMNGPIVQQGALPALSVVLLCSADTGLSDRSVVAAAQAQAGASSAAVGMCHVTVCVVLFLCAGLRLLKRSGRFSKYVRRSLATAIWSIEECPFIIESVRARRMPHAPHPTGPHQSSALFRLLRKESRRPSVDTPR